MMNGFQMSNITKGLDFPIDNRGQAPGMLNPNPWGVTDFDAVAGTASMDDIPEETNTELRMVYTLPAYPPALDSDMHACFVFGLKDTPRTARMVRSINALDKMIKNKFERSRARISPYDGRETLQKTMIMNLPLVNMFLHDRCIELKENFVIEDVYNLIQPLGVNVTQNDAKQSASSNGKPTVVSIMHQGLTDTYNIWGNAVQVDATLYFLIVPVKVTKEYTQYNICDDASITVELGIPETGFIWRVIPYHTVNGQHPKAHTYCYVDKKHFIEGGYWKVGRVMQRTPNEYSYMDDGGSRPAFQTYNSAIKQRPIFEMMIDANTTGYA